MKLYHGTTTGKLKEVERRGIHPSKAKVVVKQKKKLWFIPYHVSKEPAVFLTPWRQQALDYAKLRVHDSHRDVKPVVCEVEVPEEKLRVDWNVLEWPTNLLLDKYVRRRNWKCDVKEEDISLTDLWEGRNKANQCYWEGLRKGKIPTPKDDYDVKTALKLGSVIVHEPVKVKKCKVVRR